MIINLIFFLTFNVLVLFLLKKYYYLLNIYDNPDHIIKAHEKKMPVYGGILFFINFVFYLALDILFFHEFINGFNRASFIFIISTFSIFFMGLIDDKYLVNPLNKSIQIIFFSSILIFSSESFLIKSINLENFNEIKLNNFSFFFTVLCVYLFVNAYNMLDGADLNVGIYNFFLILSLFYKSGFENIFLIFLISNIFYTYLNYKKKTFLGNNGAYFFSFLVAFLIIYYFNNDYRFTENNVIFLTLVPIIELIRLFFSRIIKNKSPFLGDSNHLHHISCNLFGKYIGVIASNIFIVLPFMIDQIFKLNLWLNIFIFLFFYFLFISVAKKIIYNLKKIN